MKKVLSCLSLLIVLYSCNSSNSGSPKGTVSAFIEAAKTGNIAEVKKHITKSDVSLIEMGESFLAKFDPNGAKDMTDKMAKEFKDKTKDASIEIKDEKVDGDKATVDVKFSHEGKSETRPFSLVKEDGQWKISLLSTGMKNSGSNNADMKDIKNINMDSIRKALDEGMKEYNKMDKDSLKKIMEEGMKEVEKLKDKKN